MNDKTKNDEIVHVVGKIKLECINAALKYTLPDFRTILGK